MARTQLECAARTRVLKLGEASIKMLAMIKSKRAMPMRLDEAFRKPQSWEAAFAFVGVLLLVAAYLTYRSPRRDPETGKCATSWWNFSTAAIGLLMLGVGVYALRENRGRRGGGSMTMGTGGEGSGGDFGGPPDSMAGGGSFDGS